MPYYNPDQVIDPDDAICPVVGLAIDTKRHTSQWHTHGRTQLLYQAQGAVTVYTDDRVGQLAPLQAAWLPAGQRHRTVMHGQFSYRSLYFDVQAYPNLPSLPAILEVSPLLRELILRVTQWSADDALNCAQTRLVATLLDELAAAHTLAMHLPMPRDKRLQAISRALLDDPSLALSLSMHGGIKLGPARELWHEVSCAKLGSRLHCGAFNAGYSLHTASWLKVHR